jgi:hypothetical protein
MEKRKFTVTKTLSGQQSYRKWSDYSEGDTMVGEFVGIHVCQYKKNNVKLRILEANFKDGSGDTYTDKVLVVNHCGALENAMDEVELGEFIQIEYTGTTKLMKGPFAGKDCHTVAVSVVEIEGSSDDGL